MPDESNTEPGAAVEGEVDDLALEPDGPPAAPAADAAVPAVPAADAAVPAVPAVPADAGYTPGGVPTFESVREKIETRYGTSIGASELAAETPEGRTVEEQYDARQRAAADRLAQIRESMRDTEGDSQ